MYLVVIVVGIVYSIAIAVLVTNKQWAGAAALLLERQGELV